MNMYYTVFKGRLLMRTIIINTSVSQTTEYFTQRKKHTLVLRTVHYSVVLLFLFHKCISEAAHPIFFYCFALYFLCFFTFLFTEIQVASHPLFFLLFSHHLQKDIYLPLLFSFLSISSYIFIIAYTCMYCCSRRYTFTSFSFQLILYFLSYFSILLGL